MDPWIIVAIVAGAVALLLLVIVSLSLLKKFCGCCQRDAFDIEKVHRASFADGDLFDAVDRRVTINTISPDIPRHYKYQN